MALHQTIPLFENTPDNTHCFQASLKMILKYFLPERDFSFEELDRITAKREGLWTWPFAGVLWMQENGFEVKNIDSFDIQRFIEEGGQYIIDEYGKEVGDAQIKNSDIGQERRLGKEFLDRVETEVRVPEKEDIQSLMNDGYLVTVNVNSRALNGREGYSGHGIVITGFDESGFRINNPGPPAIGNHEVSYDLFEKAWAYPNDKAKNILAFRMKNPL